MPHVWLRGSRPFVLRANGSAHAGWHFRRGGRSWRRRRLPCQSSSLNRVTARPASLTIPPIVIAFTGLCRGNGDEKDAVAHYNVLALAHNSETGLFETP